MTVKRIKQRINKTNLIKKTYTEVSGQLWWNVGPRGCVAVREPVTGVSSLRAMFNLCRHMHNN